MMKHPRTFLSLPANSQWLIRKLQDVGFGKLTFRVYGGMAAPALQYGVVRTRRLNGVEQAHAAALAAADFILCAEQIALLDFLRRLEDGTRVTVKVLRGLPTSSIDLEEDQQAA